MGDRIQIVLHSMFRDVAVKGALCAVSLAAALVIASSPAHAFGKKTVKVPNPFGGSSGSSNNPITAPHEDWNGYRTWFDDGGMPRCIEHIGQNDGVYLTWIESERYWRDLRGIKVSDIKAGSFKALLNPGKFRCEKWKVAQTSFDLPSNGAREPVNFFMSDVFGYAFSPRVRNSLKQINMGGSEYHPEETAEQYFYGHRSEIANFTASLNRSLVKRFGMGFTNELFKLSIETQPANLNYRSKLNATFASYYGSSDPSVLTQISERHRDVKILVAGGLGDDTIHDKDGMRGVYTVFLDLGFRVALAPTRALGDIDDNAAAMANQMRSILNEPSPDGRPTRLLLVGMSRGVAEMLSAAAQTLRAGDRFVGLVNLSGLVKGSFVADWAMSDWRVNLFQDLTKIFQPGWYDMVENARELNRSKITQKYNREKDLLPKDAAYVNIIGVLSDSGLDRPGDQIREYQDKVIRSYIKDAGANDGLIEYPDMVIPASDFPSAVSFVIESGHALEHGVFRIGNDSYMIDYSYPRAILIASVVQNILEPQ